MQFMCINTLEIKVVRQLILGQKYFFSKMCFIRILIFKIMFIKEKTKFDEDVQKDKS